MFRLLLSLVLLSAAAFAQSFSCPAGQEDVMTYFAMRRDLRAGHFVAGNANPIYTEVFPDQDFADSGYWLWLKSPKAHGFDVKAFDSQYVYMRSTELNWTDNSSFKRFVQDLPIAARCVPTGQPGPEIRDPDTSYRYFQSCRPYKTANVRAAVFDLDAPGDMDAGGNLGRVSTRVLHYRYNCDSGYGACRDEEQFFLGRGYGLWQWQHLKDGSVVKTSTMNDLTRGSTSATLGCPESYQP